MKKHDTPIIEWANKIKWEERVKAVCKPCWEIKYCPYGPLVEDSPLKLESDEQSCRIFGHDCPVFHCAEPFTETKELRRISREIPRVVQFRVLKRENQICSVCGNSVKDENVEFDHIIPWSKGGSSEESNIRLLCSRCNKKRGNKFEDEFLINNAQDHMREPHDIKTIDFLKTLCDFGFNFIDSNKMNPMPIDFANYFTQEQVSSHDEWASELFNDINELLKSKKINDLSPQQFKAIKYRWGFVDYKTHSIKLTSKKFDISLDLLVDAELIIMKRLGFMFKDKKEIYEKIIKK